MEPGVTCLTILWKCTATHPSTPGRIQRSCLCGWDTETFEDTDLNRERLRRRGTEHTEGAR